MVRGELRALRPRALTPEGAPRDLEEQLDWVGACCARAIAERWDTGRISAPREDALPFEDEVRSFLQPTPGRATLQVAQARALKRSDDDAQVWRLDDDGRLAGTDGAEPIAERTVRAVAHAGRWVEQRARPPARRRKSCRQ